MEVTNRNTFTDEKVYFDRSKGLIYIGKACYQIKDLEKIIKNYKVKDLNDSLNYRVRRYAEN